MAVDRVTDPNEILDTTSGGHEVAAAADIDQGISSGDRIKIYRPQTKTFNAGLLSLWSVAG